MGPGRKLLLAVLGAAGIVVLGGAGLVWMNAEDEPANAAAAILTITFDDALRSQHLYGFPILREHGLRGTTYLTTGLMTDIGRDGIWSSTTWAEAAEWLAAGWEIGSHAEAHRALPDLSDLEVGNELAYSAMRIHRELGVVPTAFSAPFGAVDARVRAMIEDLFLSHVRTRSPLEGPGTGFNTVPPADRYDIARFEVSRDIPAALVCERIALAAEEGAWLVLSFHGILPEPTADSDDFYAYSVAGLSEIATCAAEEIAAGRMTNATLSEVLER